MLSPAPHSSTHFSKVFFPHSTSILTSNMYFNDQSLGIFIWTQGFKNPQQRIYFNLYFNFCLFLRSISVPPHQNISSLTRDLCCSLLLMECPEQYLEPSSSSVTNCCLSEYIIMLCISLAVFAGSCLWLFFSVFVHMFFVFQRLLKSHL